MHTHRHTDHTHRHKHIDGSSATQVALANHTLQRKTEDSQWKYEVSPESPCVFQSTQTFGRGKGPKKTTYGTVGGLMNLEALQTSEHVCVHLKFQCSTSNQSRETRLALTVRSKHEDGAMRSNTVLHRYVSKDRCIKPLLPWLWLRKPIRLTKGSIVQVV